MEEKIINVAIVGAGNCASSLYQGLHYYSKNNGEINGLMRENIGGYLIDNIKIVAVFDVDKRKIGKAFKTALQSPPNCTPFYYKDLEDGPIVNMGKMIDSISPIMQEYHEEEAFRAANMECCDVVSILKKTKTDILINYLPVGSQKTTEFYANACLESGVCFLNCIPVFIASNPEWEKKFINANLALIGDDMKSQFGASIISQMFQELAISRGHKVKCHIQRNIGGNTDFLNMTDKERIKSKKESKENVLKFPSLLNNKNNKNNNDTYYHAGPSEYIKYYKDNKVANFHLELEGFMGAPVILDAQLSVMDSPNSAGVVIDAIRYLKVAHEMGIVGSIKGPSAFTQKTPPSQMSLNEAEFECNELSNRRLTNLTRCQCKN